MDEPTAAMGIQETHSAIRMLKHLQEQGMTQLIISHNLHQVFSMADHIYVLRSGCCVASVATRESNLEQLQQLILQLENQEEAL